MESIPNVIFKDLQAGQDWADASDFLKEIAGEFIDWSHGEGVVPTITRLKKAVDGDSGVHEAGRAIDFRDEFDKGKFLYHRPARDAFIEKMNEKYKRVDGKPTVLWHSFQPHDEQGNPVGEPLPHHFHIQIPADIHQWCDLALRADWGHRGYPGWTAEQLKKWGGKKAGDV